MTDKAKHIGHELKGTMDENVAVDTIELTLQTLEPGESVTVKVNKRQGQPVGSVDVSIQTTNPEHYIFPSSLFGKRV